MARRKRKKSSSVLGALLIEGVAACVFLSLFVQARAERQKASSVEKTSLPVIQEMFQRTPYQDLLAKGNF